MSQNLARLSSLFIEEIYGPFLSTIFSALTSSGRLPVHHIAQRCRLPLKQVRTGLAVLVQHRLVYHHTTFDGRTTYEANLGTSYSLMRTGRLFQTVQSRLGLRAAKIVKHLLVAGHASVRQLEILTSGLDAEQHPAPQVNGSNAADHHSNGHHYTAGSSSFRKVLQRLIDEDFVREIRETHFQTLSDARADAESHVKSNEKFSIAKGKKGQQELEEKINVEMAKRGRIFMSLGTNSAPDMPGTKRQADDEESGKPAPKRIRMVHEGTPTRIISSENNGCRVLQELTDELILSVNISKVTSTLRSEKLTEIIAKHSGKLAAQVFTGTLQQMPTQFHTSDTMSAKVALRTTPLQYEVDLDRLLLDVNAQDSFDTRKQVGSTSMKGGSSGHGSDGANGPTNGHVNGSFRVNEDAPIPPQIIKQQLHILAEPPFRFLLADATSGRWTVNAQQIKDSHREREVSELIRKRFGPIASRVTRILADKGKVDERWLQEIGLLSAKDLRQTLATLSSEGFLELQEVPREPQRQPNRTIFLWFYDAERVERVLLEDIYKSMAKLLKRMNLERRMMQSTLEKIERSDVRGKEENFLSAEEMNVLKRWRRKECWLLAELDRLDQTVATLRDI